jgi:hypothetical protein
VGIVDFIGRVGTVINHEIKTAVELIGETRKGYNQKGILYNSSGEDSPPVKDDKIVFLKIDGTGKCIVVGVFNESQGAKPGEKIFFARDEGGAIKSKLSMLGDGSAKWELDDLFSLLANKTVDIEAKEDLTATAAKKATLKGADVEINGKVVATGGSFKCAGTVAPKGSGALCGCKFCYVTGAPVAGDTAEST